MVQLLYYSEIYQNHHFLLLKCIQAQTGCGFLWRTPINFKGTYTTRKPFRYCKPPTHLSVTSWVQEYVKENRAPRLFAILRDVKFSVSILLGFACSHLNVLPTLASYQALCSLSALKFAHIFELLSGCVSLFAEVTELPKYNVYLHFPLLCAFKLLTFVKCVHYFEYILLCQETFATLTNVPVSKFVKFLLAVSLGSCENDTLAETIKYQENIFHP